MLIGDNEPDVSATFISTRMIFSAIIGTFFFLSSSRTNSAENSRINLTAHCCSASLAQERSEKSVRVCSDTRCDDDDDDVRVRGTYRANPFQFEKLSSSPSMRVQVESTFFISAESLLPS